MKLEKLSKGRFIKTSIIVLVFISIFGVIFINRSKAKYRVTQSIQVVSGEVNYTNPDLNVLALYQQINKGDTSDGNYESITTVPTGDYKVNTDKSYCTKPSTNTNKIFENMIYNNGKVSIDITEKGTKCYVYLDRVPTLIDKLKEKVNSTNEGCPAYEDAPSVTTIEDTKSLLCKGIDDFGDTYYYRGKVENNWVKIGNFYWRIIRFNGNESIRLIYSGAQISTSGYTDTNHSSAQYAKYDNSTLKGILDNWYNANLKNTYGSIMDGNIGFCNDADMTDSTYFKPYTRLYTNKKPTFKCNTKADNLFTTSGGTEGNQKLTNPIGLITVDEASFAGGIVNKSNSGYYLYTGRPYWTMSPFMISTANMHIFRVDANGKLINTYDIDDKNGVLPVINLRADTQFTENGDGTRGNPYEVII